MVRLIEQPQANVGSRGFVADAFFVSMRWK
jgi:hypothetical protein